MNILLSNVGSGDLAAVLKRLHEVSHCKRHQLVENAAAADIILLCGSWSEDPSSLLSNLLYSTYPQKCTVYSEDDIYLPLLPGVYCSPRRGIGSTFGFARSFSYISRHAGYGNPHVRPLARNKDLLFSFQGASSSFLRKRLFRLDLQSPDVVIEDTSAYWHWDTSADRSEAQRRYAETVARSHFVLCPRGSGTGSHRLFEVMSMGVTPVLIADDYPLPSGPDWDSFLIRVPEKRLGFLASILQDHRHESESRGRRAREEWLKWFSAEQEFDHIIDACQATLHAPRAVAALFGLVGPAMVLRYRGWCVARRRLRSLVLKVFLALDVPFPFALRGHDK